METRKQKEIKHYDSQAQESIEKESSAGDFEGFNPRLLSSYSFCYELIEKHAKDKKILDYGCGNGVHTSQLAKFGKEVIGIDLSKPSIDIAEKRIERKGLSSKAKFLVMDCEKLDFPDNSFDLIFDGGTFSSLDINKAFPELKRVLKPGGIIIGIETLGHNPFTNFKREINRKTGKRTDWAVEHILKLEDLDRAKTFFKNVEPCFFHLTSWIMFPFLRIRFFSMLLKLIERIDRIFLKLPSVKKYAFKVVFILSNPRK